MSLWETPARGNDTPQATTETPLGSAPGDRDSYGDEG